MHAFSGCPYWTFTIHCEHCGHMIFRLGYCSEMQLMQHWDHQFNWHCTEYTLTVNETKMTRNSSFHTISWFCFCLRCGALAHPGQLHHEHLPQAPRTVLDRSRTGLDTHGTVVYTLPWRVIFLSVSSICILCSPVLAGLFWSREQRGRWRRPELLTHLQYYNGITI